MKKSIPRPARYQKPSYVTKTPCSSASQASGFQLHPTTSSFSLGSLLDNSTTPSATTGATAPRGQGRSWKRLLPSLLISISFSVEQKAEDRTRTTSLPSLLCNRERLSDQVLSSRDVRKSSAIGKEYMAMFCFVLFCF